MEEEEEKEEEEEEEECGEQAEDETIGYISGCSKRRNALRVDTLTSNMSAAYVVSFTVAKPSPTWGWIRLS